MVARNARTDAVEAVQAAQASAALGIKFKRVIPAPCAALLWLWPNISVPNRFI